MFSYNIKFIEDGNYIVIYDFPYKTFLSDCRKYFSSNKFNNIIDTFGFFTTKVRIHKFFLPEFTYLLQVFPQRRSYTNVINLIYQKTWLKDTLKGYPSKIDYQKFTKYNLPLKPYQLEFIKFYEDRKNKFHLNGLILAFEQGLGKTLTSIALMDGLNKDCVIIVAPKSTIRTVWAAEIKKQIPDSPVWVIGDSPQKARFYIVNYESIQKLDSVLHFITSSKDIGIIVDECHNFRTAGANRVKNLISLSKATNCRDILLMSGTPIKALGSEMIPALELIDPYFDEGAMNIFKKTFGLHTEYAIEVLRNRLGLMMYRKTKDEVLQLPKKTDHVIKVKIPNGKSYTEEAVKSQILKFIDERTKYYKTNHKQFEDDYNETIEFLKNHQSLNADLRRYLGIVDGLKKNGYNHMDADIVSDVTWANKFENEKIRPLLPTELRRKFDGSRAVIKYVNLKIMGEVIGGLLSRLRAEMFSEMIKFSPICDIIHHAEGKTILFTTYVKVAKQAMTYISDKCNVSPLLVTGETSKNLLGMLKSFKDDTDINPLVATIQTLSTGVTLTTANTVIFINQPWRYVDKIQAEDRVHRIGQEKDVFIYTLTLDTGSEKNLSTRINEIVAWSQNLFEGIIGDKIPVDKEEI